MTAAEKILQKALVATGLDSAGIDLVQAGLKDRALFSSKIEAIRHLQTAQNGLADLLSAARNEDGAVTSRAQLVSDLMRSARENGIATGAGGLTDPGSAKRSAVVVDTNAGLARGYVSHAAGASKGARMAFPAVELVRVTPAKQPRDWSARWKAAGGKIYGGRMICLKGDTVLEKLSRFGVPYPPFDYGSGMGLADVSFEECVALGILKDDWVPGEEDPVADFNARLEEELTFKGDSDPSWRFLKESFGDQVKYADGKVRWQADIIKEAYRSAASGAEVPGAVRFGGPTPESLAAAGSEASAVAGKQLTMPSSNVYHEMRRHVGAAETDPRNIPLTERELELIPHAWRSPDRVTRDKGRGLFYDLKSSDGGWYRLVVDTFPNELRFRTFYKVKAGASGLPVPG